MKACLCGNRTVWLDQSDPRVREMKGDGRGKLSRPLEAMLGTLAFILIEIGSLHRFELRNKMIAYIYKDHCLSKRDCRRTRGESGTLVTLAIAVPHGKKTVTLTRVKK